MLSALDEEGIYLYGKSTRLDQSQTTHSTNDKSDMYDIKT